jgi:hypothetical protein
MTIQNVPEIFTEIDIDKLGLFVHDFKMSGDAFKSKVNLNMHMFSFLQKGKKHVHFLESSVDVSSKQSILIKRGNCLWSEMVDNDEEYYCKLFFFSEDRLRDFLKKHSNLGTEKEETPPYFIL